MTEKPKNGHRQEPKHAQLPPDLQQRFQEAVQCYQRGLMSQAETICKETLKSQPSHFGSLHLLSLCLAQKGESSQALELISRALNLNPSDVQAHNNRGTVLRDLKRPDEALASYDQAIRLKPDFAEAHNNRGTVLVELKRLDEALASYDQAIRLKPDFAQAYYNRGSTCALRDIKRLDEALANLDKAISLKPNFAEAHYSRGGVLLELRRRDEALASYDQAIRLKPDFVKAYSNRGAVLVELKRLDEALASYDQAICLKPDHEWLFGNRIHTALKLSLWQSLSESLEALAMKLKAKERASAPLPVLGLLDDLALQKTCSEIYSQTKFPQFAKADPIFSNRSGTKLRIGYFSADFHNHATLHLMAEFFECHNKTRFELYGFSFGPPKNDMMRQRISSLFHAFYDVSGKSDGEVAAMSRKLGVDIAVDLKGYTRDSRTGIFASRCAPIQINYLGYPGTMGAEYYDYIVADRTLIPPESQPFYSEKVVYMPHSYQVNDSKRRISEKALTRNEAGLPERGFVFCCFNTTWKILPAVFEIWMRLLKAADGSVLWLLEDNPTAVRNLRKEAERRGVASHRLVFASRLASDEHLARHGCADLFLDTLPCNAHTTASDALWAGLPVLTQIGRSFAARVAASLLTAMDLPELIARSAEEYEAKALELAKTPEKLAALKEKVEASRKTSPLFNATLFARHIEAVYVEIIRRYDAGLKPVNIEVSNDGVASSSLE